MRKQAACLWLTGLPASGKSSLALSLQRQLIQSGYPAIILDGDQLREGLSADLGFMPEDRSESVRRAGEVARIIVQSGFFAISALVSPHRNDRMAVRSRFNPWCFFEIYVDTPLAVCESRDPKGHYRRARSGEVSGFTGIDAPYEPPTSPDMHIRNDVRPSNEIAENILSEFDRFQFDLDPKLAPAGLMRPAGMGLS